MESDFCKSVSNHMAKWFEMQFQSDFYRCVFSPDTRVIYIGYQRVFCVTPLILFTLTECPDRQDPVLDSHRA